VRYFRADFADSADLVRGSLSKSIPHLILNSNTQSRFKGFGFRKADAKNKTSEGISSKAIAFAKASMVTIFILKIIP